MSPHPCCMDVGRRRRGHLRRRGRILAGFLDDGLGPVSVIVPPTRRLSAQHAVHVVRANVDQHDTTFREGVVITRASRTAVDLAAQGRNDLLHQMSQRNWLRPVPLQAASIEAPIDGVGRRRVRPYARA